MIANIASDDALILSHRANPAGLNFRERQPDTRPLASTHRAGFRLYCHSKSRSLGGRPQVDADLRALIQRVSAENPLWGAPRIHDELLKLGFEVVSVAKYQGQNLVVLGQPHQPTIGGKS